MTAKELQMQMDAAAYRRLARTLDAVAAERVRQRNLLASGAIDPDCSDAAVDDDAKFRVLGEEVGEVAKAIDWIKRTLRAPVGRFGPQRLASRRRHLRSELIQVAAVATAWAESLEEIEP